MSSLDGPEDIYVWVLYHTSIGMDECHAYMSQWGGLVAKA